MCSVVCMRYAGDSMVGGSPVGRLRTSWCCLETPFAQLTNDGLSLLWFKRSERCVVVTSPWCRCPSVLGDTTAVESQRWALELETAAGVAIFAVTTGRSHAKAGCSCLKRKCKCSQELPPRCVSAPRSCKSVHTTHVNLA